jgi:cytochrome c-type biogenesis protein CcmH/NrfG
VRTQSATTTEARRDADASRPQSATTSSRDELEAERDFLLKSLDDLELEHESGGIDDESYAELHDDYTARAAATVRALRDGVDARPAPAPPLPARRRVVVIAIVVVFAIVAGVALAAALGARLPGQTATGNSEAETSAAVRKQLKSEITQLQNQVNANVNDYDLRLRLADAYARNNDLPTAIKQWDAAIKIDPNRPEAQALLGRALYLVSEQLTDSQQQAQYVAQSVAAFNTAIAHAPDYPDSYFYRGVVRAGIHEYADAQTDLQWYLVKAPNGQWADNARQLLAQVTQALATPSTTVPPSTPKAKNKK